MLFLDQINADWDESNSGEEKYFNAYENGFVDVRFRMEFQNQDSAEIIRFLKHFIKISFHI